MSAPRSDIEWRVGWEQGGGWDEMIRGIYAQANL
jgi:hypothetical protein